mmetsp:Transcript_2214/g.4976  ORF Transcript_2214/g.4976 Transcript_2214/m.4976 type:complete len:239 (+) Transcript_2214:200-916(+)
MHIYVCASCRSVTWSQNDPPCRYVSTRDMHGWLMARASQAAFQQQTLTSAQRFALVRLGRFELAGDGVPATGTATGTTGVANAEQSSKLVPARSRLAHGRKVHEPGSGSEQTGRLPLGAAAGTMGVRTGFTFGLSCSVSTSLNILSTSSAIPRERDVEKAVIAGADPPSCERPLRWSSCHRCADSLVATTVGGPESGSCSCLTSVTEVPAPGISTHNRTASGSVTPGMTEQGRLRECG